VGYDIYLTNPDAASTRAALAALDLLIVQDLFLNETARELAHVFLPAAASFEKEGTFMNGERRVQRVRTAVPPPAGARADWEIVRDVARAMGHPDGFGFGSAEEIWDEIRGVWAAGAGMTYARLDQRGLQWPCPTEDHPGTTILHQQRFAHGPRARLRCVEPRASGEQVTPEYPLLLVTGRHLQQFNAGTMTARTGNAVLRPRDVLDVSPSDAVRLGLHEGDTVRVDSRHGACRLPVHVDPAVRPGELFATFHSPEAFVNQVTGDGRDPITHTPEYKRTAVRLTKVAPDGRAAADLPPA
jgi:formate dehydrogenase major subunit